MAREPVLDPPTQERLQARPGREAPKENAMNDPGHHNVVHESEVQRQHVRVQIPGRIEFVAGRDHLRGKLLDLSAGGLAFAAGDRSYRVGETYRGNLVVTVDRIAIALPVSFQVRNYSGQSGRVGCSYTELGPREISALRYLITSHLSGDLVAVGDMLHTLSRENFTKPRARAEAQTVPMTTGQRVRALGLTAAMFVAGVMALSWTLEQLHRSLFMTVASAAKVSGPVFNIAMPREGTFHSLVPADGLVKKGAPLGSFEAPIIDLVRNQAAGGGLSAEQLDKMLGQTVKGTITSPCDCRVQTQYVADSQYVARGQQLFELTPEESRPYVVARFRYDQLERLNTGDAVTFRVSGDSERRNGHIAQVRVLGQGDQVDSDVIVQIEPDSPLPANLISRPAEVMAGGWSPWSRLMPDTAVAKNPGQ